jgi:hypothetical protein
MSKRGWTALSIGGTPLAAAINTYRQAVVDGTAGEASAPGTDCPSTFGNTDIYSSAAGDPTP